METSREERKEALCRNFDACTRDCPLFRYVNDKGIHACGALCEILLETEPEKFDSIMDAWEAEHPAERA